MEITRAHTYNNEVVYELDFIHEGDTYSWKGYVGEYGTMDYWYKNVHENLSNNPPEWAEDLDLYGLAVEHENKVNS